MTKFRELQLDTTFSLAVIISGLVVGWFTYAIDPAAQSGERFAAEDSVTVTQDGRYKMTVTAQRPRDFIPASAQADSKLSARPAPERTCPPCNSSPQDGSCLLQPGPSAGLFFGETVHDRLCAFRRNIFARI